MLFAAIPQRLYLQSPCADEERQHFDDEEPRFQPVAFAGLYDVWYPGMRKAPCCSLNSIPDVLFSLFPLQDEGQRKKAAKKSSAAKSATSAAKPGEDEKDHEATHSDASDADEQTEAASTAELAELQQQARSDAHAGDLSAAAVAPDEVPKPEPIFTYTIITTPAADDIAWLHERQPAILVGSENIDKWLNADEVSWEEVGLVEGFPLKMSCLFSLFFFSVLRLSPCRRQALKLLRPASGLKWHPVPKTVGNIKNQGPELIQPIKTEADKRQQLAKGLQSWLKTGTVSPKGKSASAKTQSSQREQTAPAAAAAASQPPAKRGKPQDNQEATIVLDDD